MASRVLLHLLLTGVLFHVTAAGDCLGYMTSDGIYESYKTCSYYQFCCGTCENRYCCSYESFHLSNSAQFICNVKTLSNAAIGLIIAGIAIVFIAIICCCCCCCSCCCQKPRPVVGTTTTVVNTQCNMQPSIVQEGQYPAYQPVPTQPAYAEQPMPAYAGQPMPAGPYQTQPYVAGPPPPYHTVAGPGQPSYLIHTPAQESFTHPLLTDTLYQPAYNPAYVQSPNSEY